MAGGLSPGASLPDRPQARADERRKERSDRRSDPFADDADFKKLAKDVGKKYGK